MSRRGRAAHGGGAAREPWLHIAFAVALAFAAGCRSTPSPCTIECGRRTGCFRDRLYDLRTPANACTSIQGCERIGPGVPCEFGCYDGDERCSEPRSFLEGDACRAIVGCPLPREIRGPHGLYRPELTCIDEVCVALPHEWCNAVDDTGEGEIDEGCVLAHREQLVDVSLPVELVERSSGVAIRAIGPSGEELVVLDDALRETSRWALPAGARSLVARAEGFVLVEAVEGEGVWLSERDAEGRETWRVALEPSLEEAQLLASERTLVVAGTDRVLFFDRVADRAWSRPHDGARLLGLVGETVVSCADDTYAWLDPSGVEVEIAGPCGALAATTASGVWLTEGTAFVRLELDRAVSFPATTLESGWWLALVARSEHADLWTFDMRGTLRVTRMDETGLESITIDERPSFEPDTVLDVATLGASSVALVAAERGTVLSIVGPR